MGNEDHAADAVAQFQDLCEGRRERYEVERRYRRKDGTVFPAEVNLSPLHTPDGMRFVCTIRDITRRKAAERIVAVIAGWLGERA